MPRNVAPAFCLITVFCASPLVFAQPPAASASTTFSPLVSPSVVTPGSARPTSPQPAPARSVSPATAAHLAISAPKYIAPDPVKTAASAPDLRETDRPRNAIIRLPNYVVRQSKEAIYKEDQFITPEEKLQRTYARHRGLKLGSSGILKNDPAAKEIQEDDERVERRAGLSDLFGILQVGSDPAVERSIRAQVQSTFMNSADWITLGGPLQQSREKR